MSTIRANKYENTSTSDGGISIDNSGHVTVDGQQMPTAGALSHRNLVVNGGMTVAQRGTSETGVTGTGYKSLDRMRYSEISLSNTVSTIEQSTDAPDGFANSLKITVTTAEGSVGADDAFRPLDYRIEGQDLQHLQYGTSGAKSLTLSFYVKSSVTGTYAVTFYRVESTARQITGTYTIDSANTWEYKTITIPGDTSASITSDNANRFEIFFHAGAGSDYTSTDSSGSWGDYVSTGVAYGNTVNLQNTLNATWQATGLQLEVGAKSTSFEHRSYGDELARCQRYFQDFTSVNSKIRGQRYNSNSGVDQTAYLPVRMRAQPNVTIVSSSDGGANSTLQVDQRAEEKITFEANPASSNTGVFMQFTFTCEAEL